MPESPSTPNLYGEFVKDLKSKHIEVLPDEQVRDKIRTIRNSTSTEEEKTAARNQIIESSLRMIPFAIKKLPNQGIPPQELVGEAFEVINSCIDNVDLDFISPRTEDQVKFSTYVFASLGKKLSSPRTVVRVGEALRIPPHAEPFVSAMRKARELFMQEENREPSQSEWFNRTLRFIDETRSTSAPIPNPEQFEDIKRARFTGVSRIGKPAYRGNVDTDTLSPAVGPVEEVMPDDFNTEEEVMKKLLVDDMERATQTLTPQQKQVLEMRFGLRFDENGDRLGSMTLDEVGKVIGVTRERVRQIEARALRTLRHPNIFGHIKDYIEPPYEIPEQRIIENQYDADVSLIANRALAELTPQNINDFFEKLRKGSPKNGRLDPDLLSRIIKGEDLVQIMKSEERYFRFKSSRIMTRDVVARINGDLTYWQRQGKIPKNWLKWSYFRGVSLKEKQ